MLRPHNLAQERIEVGGSGDASHITRGGILVIGRKAVRVDKMRGLSSDSGHPRIHLGREIFNAAGVVSRQCPGHIIRTLDQKRRKKLLTCVVLARLHIKLVGAASISVLSITTGAERSPDSAMIRAVRSFLCTGNSPRLVFVFLVDNPSGIRVEKNRRFGRDDWLLPLEHEGSYQQSEEAKPPAASSSRGTIAAICPGN